MEARGEQRAPETQLVKARSNPITMLWRGWVRDGTLGFSEVFVRNPLTVAVFSASLVIGIVIGCSAPSPDGTGLNRGRGSSGSSGTDDELDGSPSNTNDDPKTGGDPSCANHEKVDDRPACDQCARAKCCAQVLECDKTPDCQAMMKCLEDCKDDLTCSLTCQIAHEKGGGILADLAACAQTKCEAECPSTSVDAGLDLDAF